MSLGLSVYVEVSGWKFRGMPPDVLTNLRSAVGKGLPLYRMPQCVKMSEESET